MKKIGKALFPERFSLAWVAIVLALAFVFIGGAAIAMLIIVPWALTHPIEFWYWCKDAKETFSFEWGGIQNEA